MKAGGFRSTSSTSSMGYTGGGADQVTLEVEEGVDDATEASRSTTLSQ